MTMNKKNREAMNTTTGIEGAHRQSVGVGHYRGRTQQRPPRPPLLIERLCATITEFDGFDYSEKRLQKVQ